MRKCFVVAFLECLVLGEREREREQSREQSRERARESRERAVCINKYFILFKNTRY